MLTLIAFVLVASGCASGPPASRPELGSSSEHTALGPGDLFHLEIVGEPDLPKEYQVAADGTVTLPYIHTLRVAGLEPQQVASEIRLKLIEGKFLTDPSVVVTVKEYKSKNVTVLGQVQRPGSFPLTPGMTVIQAISMSGGFTSLAQANRVNLSRTNAGKTKTVVVNVEDIYEGRQPDIPLQAGDSLYVPERVF